jgi:hypothetical protein
VLLVRPNTSSVTTSRSSQTKLARSVTGVTLYVDNGMHAMGMAVDSASLAEGLPIPERA